MELGKENFVFIVERFGLFQLRRIVHSFHLVFQALRGRYVGTFEGMFGFVGVYQGIFRYILI